MCTNNGIFENIIIIMNITKGFYMDKSCSTSMEGIMGEVVETQDMLKGLEKDVFSLHLFLHYYVFGTNK